MIDLNLLERGSEFKDLKTSYIIFICLSNPFSAIGLHKYTFRTMCMESPTLELGDKAYKIILSAQGDQDDISREMKAFLEYVAGKAPSSDFTARLDELVAIARTRKEWRKEYMTLLERDERMREEGREQERKNTEREAERADREKERADHEQARADCEKERADKAEKELAVLHAKLRE